MNVKYACTVLIGIIGAVLPVSGVAQDESADKGRLPSEVRRSIVDRIRGGRNVGMVIGIVDSAGTRYYGFGRVFLPDGRTPDEHTLFEIGSVTKVFTTTILADMVVRGEIRLTDPLTEYLPSTVAVPSGNDRQITLVDLATHTSGLPRLPSNLVPADTANPYADYTVDQMYSFLAGYTLPRDVGAEFEYSNFGMGLLGHILALRSGMSYQDLYRQRIGEVLGLNETAIDLTPALADRLAQGYANGRTVKHWDIPTLAGAGALKSTAADMLRFVVANMGLIDTPLDSAFALAHQERIADGPEGMRVGLAWLIRSADGTDLVWHNGGTGGFHSFVGFRSDGGLGVVVLTNSTAGIDDIGFHLLDPSIRLLKVKPSIAAVMRPVIDSAGVSAAIARYRRLKADSSRVYDFSEGELNRLGYESLRKGEGSTAIALFELNVEAYPDAANTYDSLGEAYMVAGDTTRAVTAYRKSLSLNPGNDNARMMMARMGAEEDASTRPVTLQPELLERYVGSYQLAPNFTITIQLEGDRLMGQASGQPAFEMFPLSETEFFLKVAEARITFGVNEDGVVEDLTLHQNGRDMPAPRID